MFQSTVIRNSQDQECPPLASWTLVLSFPLDSGYRRDPSVQQPPSDGRLATGAIPESRLIVFLAITQLFSFTVFYGPYGYYNECLFAQWKCIKYRNENKIQEKLHHLLR